MENARNSILDCLIQQAFVFPNKIAFQLLEEDGGEGAGVSFASLLSQTIRRADVLSNMQLEGKRALLQQAIPEAARKVHVSHAAYLLERIAAR